MKIRSAILLLLFGTAFSVGFGSPSAPPPPAAAPTATCVFTNPGFAGKCQQNAPIAAGSNEQKVCESILRCLNDSRCTATYCQATEIRTGWKLESAKVSNPPR